MADPIRETTILRHPNRTQSAQPRGKGFWCSSCDARLVVAGSKCPLCGAAAGKRRAKKPAPEAACHE